MELISIIVPVYDSERYLDQCIQSVVNQTYRMWELLLIDDGSADNSYKICIAYGEKDSRIKCIHTENHGRVHARKIGMQHAKGSLITFLDSDDWMEQIALESMYAEMQEKSADCVIAGYIETSILRDKVILNQMQKGLYNGKTLREDFLPAMLCYADFFESGIQPFLWNKLFKREIIEQSILELDERIVVGEDVVCVFPALLKAETISVLDRAFYHYCIHAASTMRTYRTEGEETENIKLQYASLKNAFLSSAYDDCLMPQLKRYILHHLIVRALPYVVDKNKSCRNFLFGDIPIGSKLIIYGAGAFGNAVYQYLSENNEYEISAWCDRDYRKYQNMKYPVMSVEDALKQKFDYVFVSVMSKRTVVKIKESLECDGVDQQKIIWMDIKILDEIDVSKLLE